MGLVFLCVEFIVSQRGNIVNAVRYDWHLGLIIIYRFFSTYFDQFMSHFINPTSFLLPVNSLAGGVQAMITQTLNLQSLQWKVSRGWATANMFTPSLQHKYLRFCTCRDNSGLVWTCLMSMYRCLATLMIQPDTCIPTQHCNWVLVIL